MNNDGFIRNTQRELSNLEAIAAIGSGAILEPLSGLAGILGTIFPGQPGQGSRWVKNIQDLAYQPRNPEAIQHISQMLQVPMDAYTNSMNWVGDTTLNLTGSPTAATIARSAPEIAGGALGLRQIIKAGKVQTPGQQEYTPPPPVVDNSRRQFVKNAGLMALAAPIASKGIWDVAGMTKALPETAAARTAATAVAKAIPQASNVSSLRAAKFFQSYPELVEPFKKGGWDEVEKALPESSSPVDYFDERALDEFDGYDNDEILKLIDEDLSKFQVSPEARKLQQQKMIDQGYATPEDFDPDSMLDTIKYDYSKPEMTPDDFDSLDAWGADMYWKNIDPIDMFEQMKEKLKARPNVHPSHIKHLEDYLSDKENTMKRIQALDLDSIEAYGDGYVF